MNILSLQTKPINEKLFIIELSYDALQGYFITIKESSIKKDNQGNNCVLHCNFYHFLKTYKISKKSVNKKNTDFFKEKIKNFTDFLDVNLKEMNDIVYLIKLKEEFFSNINR